MTPSPTASKVTTPAPTASEVTTPAPTSAASDDDCECRSISHVADEWCVAVACDPVYSAFCSAACPPDDDATPSPTASKVVTPSPTASKVVTPAPTTSKVTTPAPTSSTVATPAPTSSTAAPPPENIFERVGYVENWKTMDTSELDGFTTLLYSFLTLDATPNVDHPREVEWAGAAVYDTMTLADVLAVMTETDPAWKNPHNWQKQKVDALIDYCRDTGKKFLWAFGGWSDLTKTTSDDQIEDLVDQLVSLLALGADGLDFDWEHLSQYKDADPALFSQQRRVVGKVIASLKTALVAAGMGDKIISYTPRYNAFFPTTGSDYGQKNLATDGEGIDVFDVLKTESEFGVDAVDYVHLMMYDIHSAEGFHDAPPEGFFSRDHYDAVVRSHLDYGIPAEKIVMGFEPGPQAYTGVWGGMAYDIMTITDMKDTWGIGGVMFWAVNDPKVASNGKTVGENSIALANYAAALEGPSQITPGPVDPVDPSVEPPSDDNASKKTKKAKKDKKKKDKSKKAKKSKGKKKGKSKKGKKKGKN